MDTDTLAQHIQRPEVQQALLQSHPGPSSIGVTADPDDPSRPAVMVRVSGPDASAVPKSIEVDGESVRVIAHPNFGKPMAF